MINLSYAALALEVSGRPLLVLRGRLPMYRSLRPGSDGTDVRQLQDALRRLGLLKKPSTGRYDSATVAAVSQMYDRAGYKPVSPSQSDQQQLDAARQRLAAAEAAARSAQSAEIAAGQAVPESELLAAEGAVASAVRARDLAIAERDAAASDGADALTIAKLNGAIADAENAVAVAQARLRELKAAPDSRQLEAAVSTAESEVEEARRAAKQLEQAVGARIPRGEVVFVPSLPRRVEKLKVRLGESPIGGVFSLTAQTARIDTSVSGDERKSLRLGSKVRIDDAAGNLDFTGTVTEISDESGTNGALPGTYYVRIEPFRVTVRDCV